MAQNEADTVDARKASLEEIQRFIGQHEGRLVDAAGDSVLAHLIKLRDDGCVREDQEEWRPDP